nr:MAG TPA: portal protein [Caudoviricetes sp.]
MQLRIPFTNLSLRMNVGNAGNWHASDGDFSLGNLRGEVTEERALGIDAVYACVNLYARTIASMPLVLYRKGKNGKERATDHPLYSLLHDEPNMNMSSHTFRKIMEASLKLWGNAYAWIEFDKYYQVKALGRLHLAAYFLNAVARQVSFTMTLSSMTAQQSACVRMKWCIYLGWGLTA